MASVPEIPPRPLDAIDRSERALRDFLKEVEAADGELQIRPFLERFAASLHEHALAEREACARIAAAPLRRSPCSMSLTAVAPSPRRSPACSRDSPSNARHSRIRSATDFCGRGKAGCSVRFRVRAGHRRSATATRDATGTDIRELPRLRCCALPRSAQRGEWPCHSPARGPARRRREQRTSGTPRLRTTCASRRLAWVSRRGVILLVRRGIA